MPEDILCISSSIENRMSNELVFCIGSWCLNNTNWKGIERNHLNTLMALKQWIYLVFWHLTIRLAPDIIISMYVWSVYGERETERKPGITYFRFNLPALETSHGRWIVSPATNLNVSDRVTNMGSCFAKFCVAAKPMEKRAENL